MKYSNLPILALALALVSGCSSPEGKTAAEQKAYTIMVRDEALAELYVRNPEAKAQLEAAPGYVFLSGFSVHPGLLTFANAYGIVQNNAAATQTHVRLTRFGIGPGLTVKGYYAVVILNDPEMITALEHGKWIGGGFAEASFKFGDFGGSAAVEGSGGHVETYVWTHTGVALELVAGYAKVGPEEELK